MHDFLSVCLYMNTVNVYSTFEFVNLKFVGIESRSDIINLKNLSE